MAWASVGEKTPNSHLKEEEDGDVLRTIAR